MSVRGARLSVHHVTEYHYETPVEWAQHVACLTPRDTPWQQVAHWQLQITPLPDGWGAAASDDLPGRLYADPWGNRHLNFSHARVHERLTVESRFEVTLRARSVPNPALGPAWECVADTLRYRAGRLLRDADEFALASPYALPDDSLAAYARRAFPRNRVLAAGGLQLMRMIHTDLRYLPQSTTVATRATDALAQRSGVCQDFAHVFIAACRALGLAARYVSGYLLTRPPAGQPRLVGADASHAWVELWCPEQGWLALDPTNNMPADLDHVTLAWGRDYADVAPLRGLVRGGSGVPHVEVTVAPLEEPAAG